MARPRRVVKPKRRRRGSGSLSTAADGTIRARLPARLDPARRAREFPPGHLAEAVAWLDGHLHPPAAITAPATVTLGDWLTIWHARYVAPITAPNTSKAYLHGLRWLQPLYSIPLTDLRSSDLQGIVAAMAPRVGAANIQNIVGVWRRCLEAAVDDGLLPRNPARRLSIPRAPQRGKVSRGFTTREIEALRTAIRGHRFEVAYALMMGCALRIGECLGLHWSNVDLAQQRIWVQHQFTNGHWRDLPKGRSPRWVRLPSFVVEALIRHRDQQPTGATLVMQSPHKPGRPWSQNRVQDGLRDLEAESGLRRLSFHAGRHAMASALLDAGASPSAIADVLGHADAGVTLRAYTRTTDEARKRADHLIDELFEATDSRDVFPTLPRNDAADQRKGDSELPTKG